MKIEEKLESKEEGKQRNLHLQFPQTVELVPALNNKIKFRVHIYTSWFAILNLYIVSARRCQIIN
jgi:hypothetical protein